MLCLLVLLTTPGSGVHAEEPEPGTFRGERIQVEAAIFVIPVTAVFSLMQVPTEESTAFPGYSEFKEQEGVSKIASMQTTVRGEKPWGRVKSDGVELDFELLIDKGGESADMLGILEGQGFSFQFDGNVLAGIPMFAGIVTRYTNDQPEYLAFFVKAEAAGRGL